jgi:hypothetical protein
MLLVTRDAHGVYATAGFTPLPEPVDFMQLDLRQSAVTPLTRKDSVPEAPLTVRR